MTESGAVGSTGGPRVLMTTVDLADPGGVASYVRAVQPRLSVPVDYLTVGSRPGSGSTRVVRVTGSVGRLVSDWWRFARAVRSGRYDVVHLNPSLNPKALLRDGVMVALAQRARVPVVVFMHGWPARGEAFVSRGLRRRLFDRTYLRAAHLIVLSSRFEDVLRGWGRTGPVSVLGTAVDDAVLDGAPEGRRAGRSRFVVLFLARLDPCKGARTSVSAVRLLAARGVDVQLVVAGAGPDLAVLEADPDPHVRLLGYVRGAEKLAAFDEADVFLFPTECGEGLPVSLLEAMARGLPVVSRLDGGIPEVIADGEMGFLTASTDPADFADLLQRLADDPDLRARMSRANRDAVARRYTATAAARSLEQVYADVVAVG